MRILILDNQDSFSYNLYHLLKGAGATEVAVRATSSYPTVAIDDFDGLILSPGPGLPDEHDHLKQAIRDWMGRKPIWGICLGHQAIAEVLGGRLFQLTSVLHGIQSMPSILDRSYLWAGIHEPEPVGRYHSWMVSDAGLSPALRISSRDQQGRIMSFYHQDIPLFGVQFHPESYMTNQGIHMARNFLSQVAQWNEVGKNESPLNGEVVSSSIAQR